RRFRPLHIQRSPAQRALHEIGNAKAGNRGRAMTDNQDTPDRLPVAAMQTFSQRCAIAEGGSMELYPIAFKDIFSSRGFAHARRGFRNFFLDKVLIVATENIAGEDADF